MYTKIEEICKGERERKEQEKIMGKEITIFSVIQMISTEERWRDYIEELYAKDKRPNHILLE